MMRISRKSPWIGIILICCLSQIDCSVLDKFIKVFSGSPNNINNVTQYPEEKIHNINNSIRPTDGNNVYNGYLEDKNLQATRDGDRRIPFWNIAHMINSIDQIEPMIRNGSNGIEIDVSFDDKGYPSKSYHGFPCDCGRHCHFQDDFVAMIKHIAKISVPPASSNLQLVLFDLKLKDLDERKKIYAGESLARILHEYLYNPYAYVAHSASSPQYSQSNPKINQNLGYIAPTGPATNHIALSKTNRLGNLQKPPIRVVISINYVNDSSLIKSFMKYVESNRLESMKKLVGFDVGMNDKLINISSMWTELNGITKNIWQGDGLTNCVNLVRPTDRLREAVSMRNNQGHFRKVYYWTVDVLYQLRSILRLGPDAVLTNQPHRIIQVLEEDEFRNRYRLATAYDDPFAQYWIQPTASHMSIPTAEDARETIENVKNTSINFIKTLPDGLSAAVKKVLSVSSSSSSSESMNRSSNYSSIVN